MQENDGRAVALLDVRHAVPEHVGVRLALLSAIRDAHSAPSGQGHGVNVEEDEVRS